MEKFAVDLDKVLDEFEFNEDCAEQVASSLDSDKAIASSLMKQNLQSLSKDNSGPSSYDNRNVLLTSGKSLESHDERTSNTSRDTFDKTLDIRPMESRRENADSINDFYNRSRTLDDKVQQKQYVDFRDSEPVSLTIRNDISQKLVQKRQNESITLGAKSHNSYDKKLNQPNIKPSVSNVFSSLNDYINAPSGDVERIESSGDRNDSGSSGLDNVVNIIDKTERIVIGADPSSSAVIARDGIISEAPSNLKNEEIRDINKFMNSATPKYQNILLPVKFESSPGSSKADGCEKRHTVESSKPLTSVGTSGISLNSSAISVISGGVSVTSGPIKYNLGSLKANVESSKPGETNLPSARTRITKTHETNASRIDAKTEHVYENVYIPTEAENATKTGFKSSSRDEIKHVYENVDFDAKITETDVKDIAYERLYLGKDKNPTDSLIDNDRASKSNKRTMDSKISGIVNSAGHLKFQNLNSNVTLPDRKPVVGFSTIDDLSEEELNKYLAELEAEERAIEGKALYENVPYTDPPREDDMLRHVIAPSRKRNDDDEDANEAPIFEAVTIGELPSISDEKLQEKAKKFPVIDYSKQQGSSNAQTDTKSSDFLEKKCPENIHAPARVISEARVKEKKSKKSVDRNKKLSDEMNDDTESQIQNENQGNLERIFPAVGTMGNSISTSEFVDNMSNNFNQTIVPENNDSAKVTNVRTTELLDNTAGSVSVDINNDESTKIERIELEMDLQSSKNDVVSRNTEESNIPCVFTDNLTETNTGEASNSYASEQGVADEFSALNENGYRGIEELNQNIEEDVDDKPSRPQTLDIVSTVSMEDNTTIGSPGATPGTQERLETDENAPQEPRDPSPDASDNSSMESGVILGKQPPFWIPDSDAPNCMLCDVRFHVIKRRHHCRACGKVLCNKCCSMKYRLEYQGNIDSRVCSPCYQLLIKAEQEHGNVDWVSNYSNNSTANVNSPQGRQPNPNNPMEYCSTIPPLQQLAGGLPPPPTVMVPVGVLKREGSTKQRPEGQKSVMFSDGIRPGCDLTELDTSWDLKPPYRKRGNKRTPTPGQTSTSGSTKRQNMPPLDPNTNSYIPQDPDILPPTVTIHKGQITYHEVTDSASLSKSLKNDCEPPIMFAINRNLYAYVKITNLNCCVNRICWNITSRGLACVGQDEVILLVETLPDETQIPKDLLVHINQIYVEAIKGNTITDLGVSIHQGGNFLGSREHAGFLFIRQTFQCLQKIVLPPAPFLVGLLVHRWETPWAKVFPLRLVLRLGAEYRYYPCPLVSVRFRDAVYFEIGHTIMKVLADFRNFAYTLPSVRGLTIHMQDRTTDVLFPKNRYDQVIKGLNNSNDHVLAFASNFSLQADSHLVCIQTNTGDESSYQTQAINIHNKPRKVTGASFVVINGALKSSMGLSAKSSIVEDGLMVQIMPEKMEALKAALKNMQDFSIGCGLQGAPEPDETVNIKWVDNDVQFNLGVKSPIDGKVMDGIPSIRVHNGTDYMGTSRFIRWTEVFIIKSDDHPTGVHDPVDINKLSETIARATCAALVKLLDLLATAGLTKLAVRTTIHPDNVGYEAGSEGTRLPPIYMNSLDNELIQVLHKAAQSSQDTNTVLELIFHVLDD